MLRDAGMRADRPILLVLVGLQGSGKSTWACGQNCPVVCPDSIRLALTGQSFHGPAEGVVWGIADLPHGAIIGLGVLCLSKRAEEFVWPRYSPIDNEVEREKAFGNCGPGRWAWLFRKTVPLGPLPARGRQGVWYWTPSEAERPAVLLATADLALAALNGGQ